jgi:hypothetical protein
LKGTRVVEAEKEEDWSEVLQTLKEQGSKSGVSLAFNTEQDDPRCTLDDPVKAGVQFVDFLGHWMPHGVDSPVDGRNSKWPVTRLVFTEKLNFVSSVPQVFDFLRRTTVRADAHVCMYPSEDESQAGEGQGGAEGGQDGAGQGQGGAKIRSVVFKSLFIKDTKKNEEILWWVPKTKQAQERAVHVPDDQLLERRRFLLETRFRQKHGDQIDLMYREALSKLGANGYLEKSFRDGELQSHLKRMYQHMQRNQEHLPGTSIRMKRLRYFLPGPDEDPLSPQEAVLMGNEDWKRGGDAVFRAMSQWGIEVLGADYALVRNGLYGPHGLLASTTMPQRLHLDSVFPFFSG